MSSAVRVISMRVLRGRRGRLALGLGALLVASSVVVPGATAAPARLDPPVVATWVDLGSATSFSVLGGAGVTNTGGDTDLAGDVGLSPSGLLSGFPPGVVRGVVHDKDEAAETAQTDRQAAYDAAAAEESTAPFSGDQAGVTFKPGVHTSAAAFTNTGTMTLDADGDQNAVFVFQVGAAFGAAAASKLVLTDGALANNVFWQVVGAVSFGAGASYAGTFLGAGAISLGDGAKIKGRVLTSSTVGLTNNVFTEPVDDFVAPVVTIDGGATRSTNDDSPPISGTTDEPAGQTVSVTVDEETLTTTVGDDGSWSVVPVALTEGSHDVVASVTDASRNTGTATQTIVVDLTDPALAFDGGASRATTDETPTITGTSDAAVGTPVTVSVDDQTLATTVGDVGTWAVEPAALTEAEHLIIATVVDPAGNTATATQVLTVDQTVPVLTINGGASRSTADLSPWTYGTTAEKPGTVVHVAVGGQSLNAVVEEGGTWGVSAADLGTGSFTVIASITDAAGNTGSATQSLTVTGTVVVPPVDPPTDPPVTPPAASYRPDAEVRAGGAFVGTRAYGGGQQVAQSLRLRPGTKSKSFTVRLTNRGNVADSLVVDGTPGTARFAVSYRALGRDATRAIAAGTWRTKVLKPGESVLVTIVVRRTRKTVVSNKLVVRVVTASVGAPKIRDTVAGVVRAVR